MNVEEVEVIVTCDECGEDDRIAFHALPDKVALEKALQQDCGWEMVNGRLVCGVCAAPEVSEDNLADEDPCEDE